MVAHRSMMITRQALLSSYAPERIFGYCAACKNHGKLWTCPPHTIDPIQILGDFSQAVLYRWIVPYDRDERLAIFNEARKEMATVISMRAGEKDEVLIAGECFACERCTRVEGIPCSKPNERRYSLESLGFDVQDILEKHFGERLLFPSDPDFPGYTLVGAKIIKP